jgi:integrase
MRKAKSEAYRLKWSDIDFGASFINVRFSKTKRSRIAPLEPLTVEAIQDLSRYHEYVFTRQDGTRFHIDSFIQSVQEAAKRANIKKRIDIHHFATLTVQIRFGWDGGFEKCLKSWGTQTFNSPPLTTVTF